MYPITSLLAPIVEIAWLGGPRRQPALSNPSGLHGSGHERRLDERRNKTILQPDGAAFYIEIEGSYSGMTRYAGGVRGEGLRPIGSASRWTCRSEAKQGRGGHF
jgi:hypothetical protein